MAWGDKKDDKPADQKPPETKQLTGEEILAKMSELLSPLSTSLSTFQTETKSRLEAIEAANKKPEPTREPTDLLDDQEKWKAENLGPLAVQNILTNARLTESEVFSELRDQGWSEFVPAIKDILSKQPIQVKAENYEQFVRNVVDMVVGRESRKSGLKRKNSSFILEDASASDHQDANPIAQADREFLNFEVVTSKGKHVKRGEFLERMGIDIHNPETLKKVKDDWSKVQIVN
jgi:hypothetical protein